MKDVELCPSCKKKFEIKEFGGHMPGSKEREDINCPYNNCNYRYTRRSNGYFRTFELPENEQ